MRITHLGGRRLSAFCRSPDAPAENGHTHDQGRIETDRRGPLLHGGPDAGLSTGDAEEAAVKRALHARAAETVVPASSEKLLAATAFGIVPLDVISTVLVSAGTPVGSIKRLRGRGVKVERTA